MLDRGQNHSTPFLLQGACLLRGMPASEQGLLCAAASASFAINSELCFRMWRAAGRAEALPHAGRCQGLPVQAPRFNPGLRVQELNKSQGGPRLYKGYQKRTTCYLRGLALNCPKMHNLLGRNLPCFLQLCLQPRNQDGNLNSILHAHTDISYPHPKLGGRRGAPGWLPSFHKSK